MSVDAAKRCDLMRLVDKRYVGIAQGVGGTHPTIGRVHTAQLQIEDIFIPVSFDIMDRIPMEILLRLDVLRKHQCCINLLQNCLSITTPNGTTHTSFLLKQTSRK